MRNSEAKDSGEESAAERQGHSEGGEGRSRRSGYKKFRLNQAIAKTGYCSRRKADELIKAGYVRVNGVITHSYNTPITPGVDRLTVGGKNLVIENFVYVVLNKPTGFITSCVDERGRNSILKLLPRPLRHLRPVGRLDVNSSGLIVLTNDGELTQRLTHPSFHEIKCYRVKVSGHIGQDALSLMRQGVNLTDGKTLPAKASIVQELKDATILTIAIKEGRNRQIRRMCKVLGHPVKELVRTSVGAIKLEGLKSGNWRYLTGDELRKLGVET